MCFFFSTLVRCGEYRSQTGIQRKLNFVSVRTIKEGSSCVLSGTRLLIIAEGYRRQPRRTTICEKAAVRLTLCAAQAWHLECAWCSCLEPASTLGSQGWFCSCPGAVHWSSCHVQRMLISFQTASIGELCITVSSIYFLNASRQLPCLILNAYWELNGYRILSLLS
jgi:hypothetical protein